MKTGISSSLSGVKTHVRRPKLERSWNYMKTQACGSIEIEELFNDSMFR